MMENLERGKPLLTEEQAAYLALYDAQDLHLMRLADAAKARGADRVEELVRFARAGGFNRLGIAHCVAVAGAAEKLEARLREEFTVVRVDCKVGHIPADLLVEGGKGTACNPIGQAKELALAGTDLNIVLGLCLGHDLIFARHSAAPITTLVVKDRLHQHNPIAALR
jgi:uncharacterized metal-binding protein